MKSRTRFWSGLSYICSAKFARQRHGGRIHRLAIRLRGVIDSGGVPREQKMLKGHLPRVIYHQVYLYTKKKKGKGGLATCRGMPSMGSPSFRMSQKKSCPSVDTVAHSVPVFDCGGRVVLSAGG